MSLSIPPKRHRFPISLISHTIWLCHRFNHSDRDVQEQLSYRGIIVSHETIRLALFGRICLQQCLDKIMKFSRIDTYQVYSIG